MSSNEHVFGFETLQLHAGHNPEDTGRSRAVPIYQTTSFVYENFDRATAICAVEEVGPNYSRMKNPTNEVFEERVAALEGGSAAVALGSGQAATSFSIFNITHSGDEIVAAETLYGGTYNLFATTLPKHGITTHLVNPQNTDNFRRALTERTKAIFVESIGNPELNIVDIEKVSAIAADAGIPLIVDNTFATPYLLRPFDFGANVVVHSATKFLGGHGTSMGGIVVDGGNFNWANGNFPDFTSPDPTYHNLVFWDRWGNNPETGNTAFSTKLRLHYLRDLGASLSPFNAFLFLQGVETLSFRLQQQVSNAQGIAEFLEGQDEVSSVSYPGLPTSKYHDLAAKYLPRGAGSILTFDIRGGQPAAKEFIEALKVFSFLANVGDSKSLVVHPATVTHGLLTPEQQQAAGVHPGQVRLSIGTENIEDLRWDLTQAFSQVSKR